MKTLVRLLMCAAGASCIAAPQAVNSQAFPVKPIRIIVPYDPGGAVDIMARAVVPKMTEDLGQPVIVENRAGAAGQIGSQQVARSAPDGYTILFTIGGTHILSLFNTKNLPYHPLKDFTPITAAAVSVICIAASASFAPGSVKAMIDYARRNPGKLSYGSSGIGSDTHLGMEQIRLLTGIDMVHVPYKGGGPLMVALVSGQLEVGALPLAVVMPQVRVGKVKVLGVFLPKPFPPMPDVSTVSDAVPNYVNLEAFTAVFGPAGLQQPVLGRLHGAIVKALYVPEVREKLDVAGQLILGNTPEEFAAQIRRALDLATKLVKAVGIQPE
jgi:tripartite-type tricarboxylate transporter receptor subunit TctC